jgi:outer membrane protein, multidrug efflux system
MKRIRNGAIYLILLVTGAVFACSPFAPQPRSSPEGEIPKTFSLYTEGPGIPERWWESFRDPELNALVEGALSGSFTIREAWARLRQANALALQAGSGLVPDLNFSGGTAHERRKTSDGRVTRQTEHSYYMGLTSSYEIDLWGRIRSAHEAARLEATASGEDVRAAAITVAAEVAERWIGVISQRMQKRLLLRQLQTNQTYLDLVELRFRKAMVSALDVYQQRQVVSGVKAQIPLVEAQEKMLLYELALLLGKPPGSPMTISRRELPELKEIPAPGIPADLLANRPDIRAAGLRLKAADWQVAAARANRLPSLTLTANTRVGPAKVDLVFDNWLLSLASNLVAPILDGNRRAAEVDRTRAVVDERLWTYREKVLTGIKEVEDVLVLEEKQRDHIEALETQIQNAERALDQAREQYRKGIADYLPVLTQLLAAQRLERDLIKKRAQLLLDRVGLYRALGGTRIQESNSGEG